MKDESEVFCHIEEMRGWEATIIEFHFPSWNIHSRNFLFYFIGKLHASGKTWIHDLTFHLATKGGSSIWAKAHWPFEGKWRNDHSSDNSNNNNVLQQVNKFHQNLEWLGSIIPQTKSWWVLWPQMKSLASRKISNWVFMEAVDLLS
jgi:hypothetical protein